jgi:hypothetical protein
MRRKLQQLMLVAVIPMALALIPAAAEAQRGGHPGGGAPPAGRPPGGGAPPAARPPGGHPGGGTVVVRGGYYGGYYGGYPYLGLGWGWGGYWGYGPYWGYPYPYWGPGYYDTNAELRLEVKPKQAQVYLDGYYAGIVDDFDGTFERLRFKPGDHELVLYLEGYQTVKQNVRLGQRQEGKIKFQMTPLAAGQTAEPPPQPKAPPPDEAYAEEQAPPARRPAPQRAPSQEAVAVETQGFGSLVIRVQPAGSEVFVDGERWQGPEGSERLVIQVPVGSHKVEVRKEGSVPFSARIEVRSGETVPLNVSLPVKGD